MAAELRIATTKSGFVIGVTRDRSGLELKHLFNVGNEGTGPNPVPELAGATVRMASLVEDDAGRPLAPPEDALH